MKEQLALHSPGGQDSPALQIFTEPLFTHVAPGCGVKGGNTATAIWDLTVVRKNPETEKQDSK